MLSPEHQSAQMSKITNDDLTHSGTGCFIAVPCGDNGCQRVNNYNVFLKLHCYTVLYCCILINFLKTAQFRGADAAAFL